MVLYEQGGVRSHACLTTPRDKVHTPGSYLAGPPPVQGSISTFSSRQKCSYGGIQEPPPMSAGTSSERRTVNQEFQLETDNDLPTEGAHYNFPKMRMKYAELPQYLLY